MGRLDVELADADLPPLDRSAWVEVDLDALTANATALAAAAAPASLGIVVKADGYGHGLEAAARCAVRGGATWLCVATAAEARRLRHDGYQGRVLVLYPVPVAVLADMARLDVDVSIGSIEDAEHAARTGSLRAHIEIDTGMTRGGVPPESVVDAAHSLGEAVQIAGIWTHLAEPDQAEANSAQLVRLDEARAELRRAGIDPPLVHVAASGGLAAPDVPSHDLVRVGLGYYGYEPIPESPSAAGLRPALSVRAYPVRVAPVAAGTKAGYGGEWTAPRPSVVATVPIGYADGWSRSTFEGGGSALVKEEAVPIAGRVSSDSLLLDVSAASDVGPDTEVVLLGQQGERWITADDVAGYRNTISWEVLQQLSARLTRVYRSGGRVVAVRRSHATAIDHTPASWLTGRYQTNG